MNFSPHDYQAYAIDYIKTHPAAAVLLDMGLGKTVISLTAIADLLFDNAGGSILAWVIEGAKKVIDADYHIPVPACVESAIEDYRSRNDWFGHFLED